MYLRKGETVALTMTTGTACEGGDWEATLKVFGAAPNSCTDGIPAPLVGCGSVALCQQDVSGKGQTYTANADGWVTIVADGATAFGDEGAYTLAVKLTCSTGNCECP